MYTGTGPCGVFAKMPHSKSYQCLSKWMLNSWPMWRMYLFSQNGFCSHTANNNFVHYMGAGILGCRRAECKGA